MKTLARILMLSSLSAMVMTGAVGQEIDTLGLEPLTVWMEIPTAPGNHPPRLFWHCMVYDSIRGEVLMHGGVDPNWNVSSYTWAWDGRQWSLRSTGGPKGWGLGCAFEPVRGILVLHGGIGFGSLYGYMPGTWEWDGQQWRQAHNGVGGPNVRSPAMAYHPGRGRVLLHGGTLDVSLDWVFSDTWEWDGSSWTVIPDAGGPVRGHGHQLVYDAKREVMVLFGGMDGPASAPVDTWEFSEGQWQQVATEAEGPTGPRDLPLMYYDPIREVTVLTGGGAWLRGSPGPSVYQTDTWEWDGVQWRERNPVEPLRQRVLGAAAAYDEGRGRWVQYGGARNIDITITPVDNTYEYGSFERIRLGKPWISNDGDFCWDWSGGVPPFQVQWCPSLLEGEWQNLGIPMAQLQATIPATDNQGFFHMTMGGEGAFSGTEVHVAWLAQPPPTTNTSGNVRIEGWERLWYDDADDDLLDGYVTWVMNELRDPQGQVLEAGGTFQVRQQLDTYTVEDFLSGAVDINQVVQGPILWQGRWTATPPDPADAIALDTSGGLLAFYMHQASEDPNVHQFRGRIHAGPTL